MAGLAGSPRASVVDPVPVIYAFSINCNNALAQMPATSAGMTLHDSRRPPLLSCDPQRASRILRRAHFVRIGAQPVERRRAREIAAARTLVGLGIVDARRYDPLHVGLHGAQDAPAGARDHQIADRKILMVMIDDPAHAFGNRLILQMNAVDPGVADVA